MRKLNPFLAFLANFAGFGLGYLYVGRLRFAIGMWVFTYGGIAALGWTRLVLRPWGGYLFFAFVTGAALTLLIHPVVLARAYRSRERKPYNRWWIYIIWSVATIALNLAIVGHRGALFGYETFRTASVGMAPTLELGDFFMVDTWRYRSAVPAIGEIVLYQPKSKPGVNYVKRIVGLPGDAIEIRHSVLYRNGQVVVEPYLHSESAISAPGRVLPSVSLGEGEFFVLGDYRDNSLDSRFIGPIARRELYGRAEYIWLSFAHGGIDWHRFPTRLVQH
jgi:signal peptidase I